MGGVAIFFGLMEDITKQVDVMQRLLATLTSGLLAWWITDYSLTGVDIWGVDWLLSISLISKLLTAFAVGGVANSINIIDGLNGVASMTSTLAFIAYGMIGLKVGDIQLAQVALVLAVSVFGFFWANWPFGKIFLGDGGSYFIGFALASVAVMLIEGNASVSAFATLVVCVHPVTEVWFSICRRNNKRVNVRQPDRMHFHSLFKRRYAARWFGRCSVGIRNSLAGLLMAGATITALIAANLFYGHVILSFLAFVGLVVGYMIVYAQMVRHHW